jgi:hypothetical protein
LPNILQGRLSVRRVANHVTLFFQIVANKPGECRIILNNQKICLMHTRMPFKNLHLGYDAQMTKNNRPSAPNPAQAA